METKPDRRKAYEARLKRLGFVKVTVWVHYTDAPALRDAAAASRAQFDDD